MYRFFKLMMVVFVMIVFSLVCLMLFASGAAADDGGNVTVQQTEIERVDPHTTIINSSYSESTGTATLVLESDRPQQITITDAGAFQTGGEVNRRQIGIQPNEPTTVELRVTEVNGLVGIAVDTDRTLYAHLIEVPDHLFYTDPGWGTVRIVSLGSGAGVLLAVVLDVFRRKFWKNNEVRKLA